MSDDIYDLLKKNDLIKSEKSIKVKKERRLKERRRRKLLLKSKNIESSESDSEDLTMTERQKRLDYIDTLIEPTSIISHIFYLKNKYFDELKDYEYIDIYSINKIKLGGFIRYINMKEELLFGGMVLRIDNIKKSEKIKFLLRNTSNMCWLVTFQKFFIFYKKNISKKKQFMSLFLEQYSNK